MLYIYLFIFILFLGVIYLFVFILVIYLFIFISFLLSVIYVTLIFEMRLDCISFSFESIFHDFEGYQRNDIFKESWYFIHGVLTALTDTRVQ